jgi:hypothetical protein
MLAIPARAQIGSPSDGSSYVGPFGPLPSGGSARFAQTIQRASGDNNTLESFSINLGDWNADGSGSSLLFRAAVYTVSGSQLDSRIFLSETRAGSADFFGFEIFTFFTPNLLLDPAISTFALVLESVATQDDALNVIASGASDYTGGALFTIDDGGSLTAVGGGLDAAFSATFSSSPPVSSVPEPSPFALVGSGMGFIGLLCRRLGAWRHGTRPT